MTLKLAGGPPEEAAPQSRRYVVGEPVYVLRIEKARGKFDITEAYVDCPNMETFKALPEKLLIGKTVYSRFAFNVSFGQATYREGFREPIIAFALYDADTE